MREGLPQKGWRDPDYSVAVHRVIKHLRDGPLPKLFDLRYPRKRSRGCPTITTEQRFQFGKAWGHASVRIWSMQVLLERVVERNERYSSARTETVTMVRCKSESQRKLRIMYGKPTPDYIEVFKRRIPTFTRALEH